MADWAAKRFWTEVSISETDQGFAILLDKRPLCTPAKAPLHLPTRALAERVAEEWRAQTDLIDPRLMPATRSANAAIDKVAVQFDEVADMLSAYGDSDLLCYRADAPIELVERQAAAWDPLLDWAGTRFAARLQPRTGVVHASQAPAALVRLDREVRRQSPFQLAAFHDLVSLTGSLVLALAAAHDRITAVEAWDLSRIDEDWQAEHWGTDDEATAAAAVKRQSLVDAKQFFDFASKTPIY
ncbi:ATP12 family protein [Pseudooceanicola sp.]|uniref:ATP12 family chaperone protein n=1 Tax=Pseudooceanicola sp. TaxID=1914328 RepID=UPI00262039A1|nr:ATP12 family protein [Pseudooceanicola sp.]MDF1856935.1 ATPase [Pseudooceanicola sp.]